MGQTVELTTHLSCSPTKAWKHVQTPRLLDHVAHPLLRFEYGNVLNRGASWPAGEHRVQMFAFGVIPIGWQIIGIEYPETDGDRFLLRDNGHGPLIRRWDHWIVISSSKEGSGTTYTDRVHIDAGMLTPFVVAYARRFYAHRQKRWRELAATDFAALVH